MLIVTETVGKLVKVMRDVIGLSKYEQLREVTNIMMGNRFCYDRAISDEQWEKIREIVGEDGAEMLGTMHEEEYASCQLYEDRYIIHHSYKPCYYNISSLKKYDGCMWTETWYRYASDEKEHDITIEDEDGFQIDATRRYIDGEYVWVNIHYPFQIVEE